MLMVENRHWWFVARRKIISTVISILQLQKDAVILDVGCANGDNLEMLSGFGEVTAIESMPDAYERAKNRGICPVYSGKLPDEIPEQVGRKNDLIVMLDVLEHIENDAECLTVLRDWLNDTGHLLITVPAYQFLWSHHDDLHHHKRRYTVKPLKKLLVLSGWEIEYISYYNTFLFPLALIERLKQKLFPSEVEEVLNVPNKYLNKLLEKIFSLEKIFVGKVSFPFGLSIILLARKNS